MTAQRLANYLKAYRRQSGLTQREAAFLMGWRRGEQVSRYEKQRRLPTLRVALAFEALFKVPVRELFPGVSDRIRGEVAARIKSLQSDLGKTTTLARDARLNARKLSWLAAHHGRPVSAHP